MIFKCSYNLAVFFVGMFLLSGCAFDRADDAAKAKAHMIGMSKEDVLACMGPPKKKASEGSTEVWSYLSTDKHGSNLGNSLRTGGLTTGSYTINSSEHDKSFCTINIVMKNGIVSVVHYNGPTSSTIFSKDDECGYAVKNCVQHDDE